MEDTMAQRPSLGLAIVRVCTNMNDISVDHRVCTLCLDSGNLI